VIDIAALRGGAHFSAGYYVADFEDKALARRIIPKRRGSSSSVPLANWEQQVELQDHLFSMFGLDDLENCTTGEMSSRPVPHVFETKEVKAITALFEKWAVRIYATLLPFIRPPVQVFNKTSRLGWPEFSRPDDKREALRPYFAELVNEGTGFLRDSFISMNVRLQAESVNKEREFLFVTSESEVVKRKVTRKERVIHTPVGRRVGSRVRLVFNLPVANLLNQILDSAIHNWLLTHPVFHHNMYSMAASGRLSGAVLFFDVKHFERHTALIVRRRAEIIGGLYSAIVQTFNAAPFLCPSDDWKRFKLLWPARDAGFSDQFASGNSAVAPAQKEVFLALYSEFATRDLGVPEDQAIAWVLNGGDHRLTIMNYGDDNAVCGDPGILKALLPFLQQYLHAEEEVPSKFLGFLYTDNGWKLGVRSYLEKTYLNERRPGSNFRKYPCRGWKLKRENYSRYGLAEITTQVIPHEDAKLTSVGLPWSMILAEAAREEARARDLAGQDNVNWIMGKDYLMTPEEKIATGLFQGMMPEDTAPFIKALLGDEWRRKISW
jgi:hypothetical protein